jgi:RNA polymerase sigma-70 factor (ECF subfamily)
LDEREAIQRLKTGDVDALEPLVRAHQLRAVRAAYLITRDRQQAEDIVQDAFIRAFERINQLRPGNPFGPWFLRIVANDALKAAARGRRWMPLADSGEAVEAIHETPDAEPGPEEVILGDESRAEVWAALGELSPEQRSLVVLRYYLGWREVELADLLGAPLGTVKWRLHEARRVLRQILSELPVSTTGLVDDRRGP